MASAVLLNSDTSLRLETPGPFKVVFKIDTSLGLETPSRWFAIHAVVTPSHPHKFTTSYVYKFTNS